jgi:hypothetical protein
MIRQQAQEQLAAFRARQGTKTDATVLMTPKDAYPLDTEKPKKETKVACWTPDKWFNTVNLIETATGHIFMSGNVYCIAQPINESPTRVAGFASWGKPTMKLDGYFLQWNRSER